MKYSKCQLRCENPETIQCDCNPPTVRKETRKDALNCSYLNRDGGTIKEVYIDSMGFSYLRIPQNIFEPYPNPKKSPLGPQKVKNDPKIKSKSKVRIERNIENENCSTT